jgi:hypothetical protein
MNIFEESIITNNKIISKKNENIKENVSIVIIELLRNSLIVS